MSERDAFVFPEPSEQAKILTLARKRFRLAVDAEAALRKRQLEDKKFAAGEHWDADIKRRREADGDPCLTYDLLKPQIKQITNQQRAMRPSVVVHPVDAGADPETAEVFQGIIRHIETQSNADDAYDQAGRDQTVIGRGWIRVLTQWSEDEDSADQEIRIKRIRNPFSIYPDPSCQERDYSDGKFLFEVSDWLPEDIQARWPNAKKTSTTDFDGLGNEQPHWINGERIRVALYWTVSVNRRIKQLGPEKSRPVEKSAVRCYVMTGLEVLESYEWAGRYSPYIPVLGEEDDTEGKVDLCGVVRAAKDPCRAFDLAKSKTIEVMALTPLAPFIAAEGAISPENAKQWKDSNRKKFAVLYYNSRGLEGQEIPPPQRNYVEPPVQALQQEAREAENIIRAVTGFFNPLDRPRDESGVALRERRQQGEHGNSDYQDGLARGIRYLGRILVDLIPKIYDAPRVLRILGRDNQPKSVMVHAGMPPADGALPEGVKAIYDLSVGRYDVTVTAGPSHESNRQEFVDQMSELFQAHPELFNILGDIYFENLDRPEARLMAERIKKMLPPQLQDQKDEQDPAAVMAHAQQLQAAVQELQGKLQEAMRPTAVEEVRQRGAFAIKQEDLAFQKWRVEHESETKIAVAELGAKIDRVALFLEERARLSGEAQAAHDRAHEVGMATMAHAHGQIAEAGDHDRALEQGEAASGHAMAQAEHAQAIQPEEEEAEAA